MAINVPTLRAAALSEKEKNTAVPIARTPERLQNRHAVADTVAVRNKTFPRATQLLVSDRNRWNQGCTVFQRGMSKEGL